MNILVTGAAGFIGSSVSEYLIKDGHEVIGIDNFDTFYGINFKHFNICSLKKNSSFLFYENDIRNKKFLFTVFSTHKIDCVVHLAAKAGVRPSIESIAEYYDVNVNGTLNLLEAMKFHQIKKMIFASSSSIYGNNEKVPFAETDMVDNPISPYASSKKSGELLCHVYSHLHGFDISCLRFFTVFGPKQRPDLAIHKFTRLIDLGMEVPMFGNGSSARDYTYIDDIVSGINCALKNLGGFRIYNLGESHITSLKNLISIIEQHIGKKAVLKQLPFQDGDVNITYADISKARKEIGYEPVYKIETGINYFVDWYKENKKVLYS